MRNNGTIRQRFRGALRWFFKTLTSGKATDSMG